MSQLFVVTRPALVPGFQLGYNMLVGIPYLREEIQIVIWHQEKWDGTGYPFGLRGEEIALGARLFGIADTFDALTSDRPTVGSIV